MWTDNGQAALNMNFIQIHRGHKKVNRKVQEEPKQKPQPTRDTRRKRKSDTD